LILGNVQTQAKEHEKFFQEYKEEEMHVRLQKDPEHEGSGDTQVSAAELTGDATPPDAIAQDKPEPDGALIASAPRKDRDGRFTLPDNPPPAPLEGMSKKSKSSFKL